MKTKRKLCLFFGIFFFLLLIIISSWLWITRPINIYNVTNNQIVTKISISNNFIKPGVLGNDVEQTIYTDNSAEINKMLEIMNQYPYNKNLFYNPTTDYKNSNLLIIRVSYNKPSGEKTMQSFQIYADGRMFVAGFGEQYTCCGIGRFGQEKTREYYNKLYEVYNLKLNSQYWYKSES